MTRPTGWPLLHYPERSGEEWYNECRAHVLDEYHRDRDVMGHCVKRRIIISARLGRHPRFRGIFEYMDTALGDSALYPPFGLPLVYWIAQRPLTITMDWKRVQYDDLDRRRRRQTPTRTVRASIPAPAAVQEALL